MQKIEFLNFDPREHAVASSISLHPNNDTKEYRGMFEICSIFKQAYEKMLSMVTYETNKV